MTDLSDSNSKFMSLLNNLVLMSHLFKNRIALVTLYIFTKNNWFKESFVPDSGYIIVSCSLQWEENNISS